MPAGTVRCDRCGSRLPEEEESLNLVVTDQPVSAAPTNLARLWAAFDRMEWDDEGPADLLMVLDEVTCEVERALDGLYRVTRGCDRQELAQCGLDSLLDCAELVEVLAVQLRTCVREVTGGGSRVRRCLHAIEGTMRSVEGLHERLGAERAVVQA